MTGKGILGIIFRSTRFGAKIGMYAIWVSIARRRAVRAFSRELRRMGLPGDVVKDLSAEYPNFQLGDLKNMQNKKTVHMNCSKSIE